MDSSAPDHSPDEVGRPNTVRSLAIIGGTILLLVAVAVIVVLLLEQEAAEYPAGSPERAFQKYLTAYRDGDYAAAYTYFSSDIQSQITVDHYVQEVGANPGGPDESRVSIESVNVQGERATLTLTIERSFGDGLGRDTYTEERNVPMLREREEWRIDTPMIDVNPAPWMLERLRAPQDVVRAP